MIAVVLIAALLVAFANGANDNSKGVATLIGSGTTSREGALRLAAIATFVGSIAALFLAQGLIKTFSGKGIVSSELIGSPAFLGSVAIGASFAVLLATRFGFPISTTHSLVGAIAGVGIAASAANLVKLLSVFLVPLLFGPLLAVAVASAIYPVFRWGRLRMGIHRRSCVCVETAVEPNEISEGGAIVGATKLRLLGGSKDRQCAEIYEGKLVGADAQQILAWCHVSSACAISFARGLNDTPKIAALLVGANVLGVSGSIGLVGIVIVAGGLLAAKRVASTMSFEITDMNDGQAFTANLVTASCVIAASLFSMPVSTTHVSCGSLFGIGAVTRQAHPKMIGSVLLAWVVTLPVAGVIGYIAWTTMAS